MFAIRTLSAKNYRTLKDLSVENLPDLVLLYGENEAGKSNVLSAIRTFFELLYLAWEQEGLHEKFEWSPQEDAFVQNTPKNISYGEAAYELAAGLSARGQTFSFRFEVTPYRVRVLDAIGPGGRIQRSDGSNESGWKALEEAIRGGFSVCEAERRFRPEWLSVSDTDSGAHPNRDNLKSVLFAAANSMEASLRHLFQEGFQGRAVSGTFAEMAPPTPALGTNREIALLLEGKPAEARGSGCQQWLLMNGILTFSGAVVGAIEEPEAHLSSSSQAEVAKLLKGYLSDDFAPHQLFVTSHSSLLLDASPDRTWFRVTKENGATTMIRHQDATELDRVFPEMPLRNPSVPMRLDLGGVVRLTEGAIRHLNAKPGTYLYGTEDLEPVRSVRLIPEEAMDDYLSGAP